MLILNENLRKLRKEKGLTQEQLALHLSVSPQAISRWENGMNCPDVSLLPVLANYYNVTTDQLLGVDITKNKEAIENIIDQAQQLQYEMKREEAVNLLHKGLIQFPNNFQIMLALITRLLDWADERYDQGYNPDLLSKVFEYGERILAECNDDDIRQMTIAYLAGAYNRLGDTSNAKNMVMKLSSLALSREIQIQNLNLGETHDLQKLIWDLCLHMFHGMENLADINYNKSNSKYSFDERIELLKKMLSIFEVLFEKQDYGYFYNCVSGIFRQLGACYANKKDKVETMYYLNKAFDCAIKYETQKQQLEYTHVSLAFDGLSYKQNEFVTRGTFNTEIELLIEKLKHPRYDFLRNDESFKLLVETKL
jgi:transcriptional regulator with XRE-family HTH domain